MLKKIIIGFCAILSVGLIIFSVEHSSKINIGSDFHVFWQSGHDFFSGNDMYHTMENARRFIYPPFAAFIFQLFAIFPLKISANIFFLVNTFILLPLTITMLFKICQNFGFNEKTKIAIILSVLCSLHYFWNNLTMFQVNFLVFSICIVGIYYYSKNKPHLSSIFFLIATFIKVFPVFFLLYVVITHIRSKKVVLYTLAGVILCLIISILPRGFETGINDHITYYFTFLKEFQKGEVIPSHTNHTLKSFMLKAFFPETRNADVDTSIYSTPLLISNILLFIISIITIVMFRIIIKSKNLKNYVILFSLIFIFTHLISGITWTAHMVTMMFTLLPLFFIDRKKIDNKIHKIIYFIIFAIAFVIAIEGKDTTGEWLYYKLRFYDIFVVYPLILFTYYCFIIINKNNVFYSASNGIKSDSSSMANIHDHAI